MHPIRLGIIGTGKRAHMFRGAHERGELRVVAGCDPDPRAGDAAREAYGHDLFVTSRVGELLACSLDAVAVCSPDYLHEEHACAALETGRADLLQPEIFLSLQSAGTRPAAKANALIERAIASPDYMVRWQGLEARTRGASTLDEKAAVARDHVIGDPSAALRGRWLTLFAFQSVDPLPESFRKVLENIAANDADPMNRALAGQALQGRPGLPPLIPR